MKHLGNNNLEIVYTAAPDFLDPSIKELVIGFEGTISLELLRRIHAGSKNQVIH